MFCRKCGAEIKGNPKFCPKCGSQISNGQSVGGIGNLGNEKVDNGGLSKKTIPLIAVGAVVILVAFLLVKGLFGGGYEKPIKNFMKAIEKQDVGLIMKTIPDPVWEEMESEFDISADFMKDELEDVVCQISDEYDGKIKIEYEIEDEHKLKKREIRSIEDNLMDSVEIKEGKRIDLSIKIFIDGEKEESRDTSINVIKVGRKWYLDPYSFIYF